MQRDRDMRITRDQEESKRRKSYKRHEIKATSILIPNRGEGLYAHSAYYKNIVCITFTLSIYGRHSGNTSRHEIGLGILFINFIFS